MAAVEEDSSTALVPRSRKAVTKFQKNVRSIVSRAGTVIKQARDGQFRLFITPHIILYLRHHHHHNHHHHHHHYHHFRHQHQQPDDDNNVRHVSFSGDDVTTARDNPVYENIVALEDDIPAPPPPVRIDESPYVNQITVAPEQFKQCQSDKCKVVHSVKTKKFVKRLYSSPIKFTNSRKCRSPNSSNDRIKRTY